MAETEEKQQQAPAAKGGKSKLVLALVGVVALGGLGGGAFVMFGKGGAEAAKHEAADKGHKDDTHGKDGKGGMPDTEDAIVALDTFVVNLADENAQRYLKVTMKVEFFGPEPPPRFAARQAQIRDLLLSLLGSKTVADVRTIEGKQQLRDEVTARISRVIEEDVVKAVYFAEFIVQ
jgi:flagellar FliL protein